MKASSFISSGIAFKGQSAVVSIAVSFVVMIMAVSISSGFRAGIYSSLAEVAGDISIHSCYGSGMFVQNQVKMDSELVSEVGRMKAVKRISPVVYGAGIVKNGETVHGVVFKGVDTADSASMLVKIPKRLAVILGLEEGDRMLSWFLGDNVTIRNFTVDDIYDSLVTEDDKMVVFCDIHTLRRALGWDGEQLSAYEVILKDDYRNTNGADAVNAEISTLLYGLREPDKELLVSTELQHAYPQLFGWLHLIDFNVIFILALMTVVAGFNMVSGLLILLFQHISTIGLLKTMGMQFRDIAATFLKTSGRLVLKGMLSGNAIAIFLCLLEDRTHFFKLNPENYFLSYLPVRLDIPMIIVCDIAAYIIIMAILLIPCAFISKVDPALSVETR